MTNTAKDTSAAPAPLTWRTNKTWGAVGLTHYAETRICGKDYTFTIDQPSKGNWQARGWRNGDFCMFRDHEWATTLRGMKAVVEDFRNFMIEMYGKDDDQ